MMNNNRKREMEKERSLIYSLYNLNYANLTI